MAPRASTKAKTAKATPKTEPESNGTRDLTVYATKDPSITMATFADWLKDQTGIEFKTTAAEAAFDRGVALGGTLRMDFQRSEFWRDHEDNPRNNEDKPKPSRRQKSAKATAKAQVDEEDVDEDDEDEDDETEAEVETPKPVRRGRPASGRKPAAATKAAAPARRGRKPAKAADEDSAEAPY